MSRPYALTAYPLSRDYRERLEGALGEPIEYVSFARLRRLPRKQLLATVRALRGRRCYLPLEERSAEAALPVLQAAALACRPSSIEVVEPTLERRRVSRLTAAAAGAVVVGVSAGGQLALRASRRELRALLREPRQQVGFDRPGPLLHLNPNLWLGLTAGGSVGHVAGVVNGFLRAGREVHVAAATTPTMVDPEARFHRLRPPSSFGFPFEVNYFRFHRTAVDALRELDDRWGYGCVYQRLSVSGYAGVALARERRLPLVLEYNGSEVWTAEHWGTPLRYPDAARAAEEACLRHAHLVVTVSDVLRDELLGRGVEEERVVCYPNGVDTEVFDPARFDDAELHALRRSLGIPGDALVATFVGTFGQWHGADVLAHAVRRLVEDDPRWVEEHGLRFLLVGDGLKMPVVRETLAGSAAEPLVHLPGLVPQHEAPRYLALSDLLLSPHVPNPDGTPFFGSPTKLFEYMAMARPIVASDLGQIGDVLRPALDARDLPSGPPAERAEERAILAAAGDEGSLLAALRFAVEQPEWRDRLARNARAAALRHYTWDAHVGAIIRRMDALGGNGHGVR